jgi:NAD(P)-dependent dehydrogenase (short-subunit alcohol dehydrogenase family)
LNATSLVERVVVVTGAASGIGRQIALDMAAIGARIVAVDRDEPGVHCSPL